MHAMVVDDEPSYLDLFKVLLQQLDITVEGCLDGQLAMDIFSRQPNLYSIVVVDVMLPGEMHGLTVAKKMKELNPSLAILVCSHYCPPSYGIDQVFNSGERRDPFLDEVHQYGEFLVKPFAIELASAALSRLIGRARKV